MHKPIEKNKEIFDKRDEYFNDKKFEKSGEKIAELRKLTVDAVEGYRLNKDSRKKYFKYHPVID